MNAPIDMSRFIEAKSDQLNADDLMGGPLTITVTRVAANDGDQPVNIFYEGDNGKPFRPCKTIRRVLVALWGADASRYVGRSMTLYRDAGVQFGGMQVGGTRISHMSHIDGEQTLVVMKTKGKKAPMKIRPLAMRQASPDRSPAASLPAGNSDSTQHGDGAGASPNAGKAQAFADGVLAEIADAEDAEMLELALIFQKTANGLKRLKTEHLAIWQTVSDAVDARRAVFAARYAASQPAPNGESDYA